MGYRKQGDTFRVNIDVLQTKSGISIIRSESHKHDLLSRGYDQSQIVTEWAEFLHWDYQTKLEIDMQSTLFDRTSGTHYINPILRKHNKYKYLLRGWSITEDDGSPINVKLNPEGTQLDLTFVRDSINGPHAIDPIILDAFIDKADMVLELGMRDSDLDKPNPKK